MFSPKRPRASAGRPVLALAFAVSIVWSVSSTAADPPENLARRAVASATSEHNSNYLAQFVTDGKIPAEASAAADLGAAWCVLQSEAQDQATLTLRWEEPIRAAEVLYWGRTSWMLTECWKEYELYADDGAEPVARGSFEKRHGPQRVTFPAREVTSLTFRFLNSHGGANPGAAEIEVYPRPLTTRELAKLRRLSTGPLATMPWVCQTDPEALGRLLARLQALHGDHYARAESHRERLAALRDRHAAALTSGDFAELSTVEDGLERLERDVLLFDVDRIVVVRRHEINASHVYTYHYEGFRPGAAVEVIDLHDPEAEPQRLVATDDGQILDLDLSYDGETVLFSWRREKDAGYHLWQVNTDGSGLRQLTDGVWHDYNPCWLPDGDIAFLSSRSPQFAYCWHAPVGTLHRMRPDGSGVVKLSANYLNDFTPNVLADGRIIYSRWEYVDRPAIPIQSLWTIHPDGTSLAEYFGNRVLSPGTFMEAQQIPGSTEILCTMTGHNGPTRGAIGRINRALGDNSQASIENLTPDVPVPNVDQGNGNTSGTKQYSCPWPLDAERFLCSIRGPLLVRSMDGACQAVALDAPDGGMQYFDAQPVRPRVKPPVLGTVDPGAAYDAYTTPANEQRLATLYLQDVYRGFGPDVARGEIAAIRVVREMQKTVRIDPSLRAFGFQFPVISCGATYAGKTVLGDVPIGEDGSAVFRVPAGMPIYFIALDHEGRAIQRMRSFTHLMPGEIQGCIGCHEHRLQGPPPVNAFVFSEPPVDLDRPEWGVRGFDYVRIVQPVLDRHCTACHHPADPAAGLDLSAGRTDFFNVSYDVLAREGQGRRGSPYVNWIPTYNGQEWNILEITPKTWGSYSSRLAEIIRTGHPDADGEPRIDMPEPDRRRIYAWIDLNVPYYGSSETAYPERVGCRRLYPKRLDAVLAEVAARRCAACHADGEIPRREWVRITEPEQNPFLMAPLSRAAGGSERCGEPIFDGRDDPDYRAILDAFVPITASLDERPRLDMDGGKPAEDVCRICQ